MLMAVNKYTEICTHRTGASDNKKHSEENLMETYQTTQPAQQAYTQSYAPARQLKTNRGLLKFILLGMITFGIYPLVVLSSISEDINTIAARYDGKKTMHYCLLAFIITPITLGIGTVVWMHKISDRIHGELNRRGIQYNFSATTFWLWNVLGSAIVIGPFVFMHKWFKAMNLLAENYNING